jgi:hypothetical protein
MTMPYSLSLADGDSEEGAACDIAAEAQRADLRAEVLTKRWTSI